MNWTNRYHVDFSREGENWIATLRTPLHFLTVCDVDGRPPYSLNIALLLGWSRSPRGIHLYLPSGAPCLGGDAAYLELSARRGSWSERLFDAGSPRDLPFVAVAPFHLASHLRMSVHRFAFDQAQRLMIDYGLNVPVPFRPRRFDLHV